MALGDATSPVLNETLSVIDEHITDMHTPRQSIIAHDRRGNDSGSEYSSHMEHRLSYINGSETDEEESALHTEAEVNAWTPDQVADYLEGVGVQKKHCDIFREQEINGEALLGMDQTTIFLKEFELGPVGPRLRTWLKIKALQTEVKSGGAMSKRSSQHVDDSASDASRNRAASMSTMLPRIPGLRESGSRTPSRQSAHRITSTPSLQPSSATTVPPATSSASVAAPSPTPATVSSPLSAPAHTESASTLPAQQLQAQPSPTKYSHAHRPSAASVRSMNHNRRHSSIDVNADNAHPPSPHDAHKKQPSFDRHWTMTTAPKSADSKISSFDAEDTSDMRSPMDLDRGYFSGNEVDNRKSRNVLRKRDSSTHSRTPSYNTDSSKRPGANRHSRYGSADTMRDSQHISAAAKAYYGQSPRSLRSSDALSYPNKPLVATKDSPTVTKLDYANSPSIDAIANSPTVPGSETSSIDRGSPAPTPGSTSHSFFSKKTSRATGLRAISDAVTGNEKALITSNTNDTQPSPIKESPIQSPARTGSSTPSGTSKSFEIDEKDASKRSNTSSTAGSGVPIIPGKRRGNKTKTSAYTRGLEQKSPAEQMISCDYSGWMKKKSSNLMTTWKSRLFILKGRRLSYYYSENDNEEKGLIDISNHRVLPANNEFTTVVHAALTRATSSPSSPQNATIPTTASTEEKQEIKVQRPGLTSPTSANKDGKDSSLTSGTFIFKLVPPRSGLSKGVNFTKPTIHYFAVDNIVQGRLWMAALIKATIDRDPDAEVTSSYAHKTISLAKARGLRVRPFFVADDGDEEGKRWQLHARKKSKDVRENKDNEKPGSKGGPPTDGDGLGITTPKDPEEKKEKTDSAVAGAEENATTPSLTKTASKASRTGSENGTRSRSPSSPSSPTSMNALMMSVHI
jgi:hypothetical protein